MAGIAVIFTLLGMVCLAAVVKPFGPFKKRWHALVVAIGLFGLGGALMPTLPETTETGARGATMEENASSTSPPATVVSEESLPATRWRYDSQRDEMRGADTHYACVESTNELRFDFPYGGGSQAELCLRRSPQFGEDVMVTIDRGQFTCFMDCTVNVKFDEGEIQRFSAGGASDGSSNVIFITNFGRFLRGLRGASRVVVEAEFFQAGNRQMVFDGTSGLNWPPQVSTQ